MRTAVFGGRAVTYLAKVDEIVVADGAGRPAAKYVCTSYLEAENSGGRPVVFAFNGGPGSSSVWLHLGLGPRRVKDADELRPRTTPPFLLVDNEDCVLDAADLVFVDPPGTGFSRVLAEDAEPGLHSVSGDAAAMIKFVSEWCRRYRRENDPKYLLGESYGTMRAATVACMSSGGLEYTGRLESLSLSGAIVLGPSFEFPSAGDLDHVTSLPSLAATAWYHDRVPDRHSDLTAHVEAAQDFARDEYLTALYAGTTLAPGRREDVARRMSELVGLPPQLLLDHDLRIGTPEFADALLKDQGDVLGWYDGRYVLPRAGRGHDVVTDDPAMGQYGPGFAGAIEPYLRDELGVETSEEYRLIEFSRIGTNWDYGNGPGRPPQRNYAQDFAVAMRRNASFELFVGVGLFDMATTFGAVEYALSHAQLDRSRLHVRHYTSGHMPYLGSQSRERLAQDLRSFLAGKP